MVIGVLAGLVGRLAFGASSASDIHGLLGGAVAMIVGVIFFCTGIVILAVSPDNQGRFPFLSERDLQGCSRVPELPQDASPATSNTELGHYLSFGTIDLQRPAARLRDSILRFTGVTNRYFPVPAFGVPHASHVRPFRQRNLLPSFEGARPRRACDRQQRLFAGLSSAASGPGSRRLSAARSRRSPAVIHEGRQQAFARMIDEAEAARRSTASPA